ncbi:MAG: VCBS repeat-containing protein [Desulfuromonadales bacterium]|nr:VCBS repeat-containing protein [Desulfuromonadales bacterium]
MPSILLALLTAFLLIAAPIVSPAAPLKTYVTEFSVTGASNKDELKLTLQGLLASRLNPNQVQLLEKPDKAELLLAGSYALFGKMFSIDVLIKNSLNGSLTKVFEQGEGQDDMIPAFGRLAQKLDRELAKTQAAVTAPPLPVSPAVPVPVAAQPVPPATAYKVDVPVAKGEGSYVVKSDTLPLNAPGTWTSDPLSGVLSSIALGRTLPSGERELFVADAHVLRYLRKGAELKRIAEIVMPVSSKILAIDAADLDRDGTPEIYVTIVDRKTVSSRVYAPADSGLELIADNQPWLFRGSGLDLKERTIFVQTLSSGGEYQNGVAELVKSGNSFKTRNSRTLPRPGNIFNFSLFRDASGVEKSLVMDEDGYLIISAADGSQLWKSSDKYGGSETYFNFESYAQLRAKGDKYGWNFLAQRMLVLPDGTLVIPRNEGSVNIGNNRTYNKHSLFGLQWSGSILREVWHTRQSPSYLADYAYDAATREVVLLEVVQRTGLFGKGKTALSINKLD